MPSTSFLRAASTNRGAHPQPPTALLVHFHDPRGFHDRRLLLPVRKFLRAFAIDIHARKFLAVRVVNGHLPMMVLAPFVMAHPAGLLQLGFFHFK